MVTYAIRVRGALDEEWSALLGGMGVAVVGEGDAAETELVGELAGEGELLGVLATLRTLGRPLLAVERLSPP